LAVNGVELKQASLLSHHFKLRLLKFL